MKKLLMLMLLAFPAFAHSEVETETTCFRSQEGKGIKLELRIYSDQAAKWSGAAVKYATSKESIPLVFKSTEQEESSDGRPFQSSTTTTWVEVVGGAVTGEYVMVRQGALIYGMVYTNVKSKKHYGFEHHPQIGSSPEKGCQW
ncbi:hypothetical protein [Pseudomonas sp. dw_612]|uniref:hypothetical protein n=1 Tax=Pseudomonas sp. dw_612 TaxID=2720080 RepID=UPI0021169F08|nr:hypothetical protein [Pseudomonas sp. dw_612]